ncbi:MAG TPA: kelch repeat-containing protein [Herpetosiphonaceae bacterium]|nr:kelch repeat-containing protein [Herpetosiphonaceae bacterium]
MKRRSIGKLAHWMFAIVLALGLSFLAPFGSSYSAVTAATNATGQWSSTGDLLLARYSFRATTLKDGRVLIEGGFAPGAYTNESEIFNPATGIWTRTGYMNYGRGEHTATLLPNGKVLVVGGYAGPVLSSAELFDPATGTWSLSGSLSQARTRHTATLLPNGKVLVTGGWIGGMIASTELYDPSTGSWSPAGIMATPRADHAAVLLKNGKVLVIGGSPNNGTSTALTEIYDPATGTWSLTGSLNLARDLFGAALLGDGRVLVAGGRVPPHSSGVITSTAEIYNPTSGTWSLTGSMSTGRAQSVGHEPLVLADGSVLVAGGEALGSSEVYLPTSGSWASPVTVNRPHCGAASALLADGRAILAGGTDCTSPGSKLVAAEVYTPGTPIPQPTEIDYFALGDSIASGHGLMDDETACRRSTAAYPHLVKAELGSRYAKVNFHHFACSGATALNPRRVIEDPNKWLEGQVAQVLLDLRDIPTDRPVLVSITVGANDFGWSNPVVAARQATQRGDKYLEWVSDTTADVAAAVRGQVELLLNRPNVAVIITEVHNPFNEESVFFKLNCADVYFTLSCYQRTEYAVHGLNSALVLDVWVALGRPERLRVTPGLHSAFHGHEAPRPYCGVATPDGEATWIQYFGDPDSNASLVGWKKLPGDCFHPNRAGAKQYASVVNESAQKLGR